MSEHEKKPRELKPSEARALDRIRRDGGLMLTHWTDDPDKPPYATVAGKTINKNIAAFLIESGRLKEHTPPLLPGETAQTWVAA